MKTEQITKAKEIKVMIPHCVTGVLFEDKVASLVAQISSVTNLTFKNAGSG